MEDKIRAAYDEMNPTPEQEERMLTKLLAAQGEAQDSAKEGVKANVASVSATEVLSSAADQVTATAQASPRRRAPKAWKVALPLAACLAVVAVLVGVTMVNPAAPSPDASSEKSSQSAAKSERDARTEAPQALNAQDMATETEGYAPGNGYSAYTDVVEPEPYPEPDNFNTEEYAAIDENGFVNTRTRPLSTVSADVDTASYCNVRRMINDGCSLEDIPDGAVRVEEMVNYFTYDYAEPAGNDLFSMQAQASTCPWNADTKLLVMGFATQSEAAVANRGSNLVFLIDVSGSMQSPDKIDLL